MKLWNAWAKNHRNARGLAAAAVLLLAILSLLSLRCNPLVGRSEVLGLVLAIEAVGLEDPATGQVQSRVLVATPDTVEVRLLLPPPVPRPGDFIPLIAEHHKKGDTDFLLDLEQWLAEGPQ